MRKLVLLPLLTALATAVVPHPLPAEQAAVPAAVAEADRLRITPSQPRQGEALLIRLDEPEAENGEVFHRGKRFPLFQAGDYLFGALPLPPDKPAGGYQLEVRFRVDGVERVLHRKFELAPVAFSVQHLRMARTTARLYNYPGVEKEEREIGAAIRTLSEGRAWSGDWLVPCPGRRSTPFGVRRLRNGRAVGRHRGLDIAAPAGTPVRAAADGQVVLARSYRKHGKTVVVDHGSGITSFYIHMSAIAAREGETVRRGEMLGRVGSTGVSTGPHLHWSVYIHGEPVDPLLFCRLSRRGTGI